MSGRTNVELGGITLLGNQQTKYPDDYAPEVLETFPNKHPENDYFVKFNAPEFTSLVSDDRTAGFCDCLYFLCSGREDGGKQIP